MQKAPDWPFHVVVYNMTAEETEKHAVEFENAICSQLLPCTLTAIVESDYQVPVSADILFSFPTETGLTPRNDVPILVHVRCRIPNALPTLQKQNAEIERDLSEIVHTWSNRDQAPVFFDITS